MADLEFHPLADLFPLMSGAEFDALVADITEHGLREPITLHDEKILDGRNRYRACLAANADPLFETWDGNGSIHAFVVSKNLHRRHLNESQRAMIAAKLTTLHRGENLTAKFQDEGIRATTGAEAAALLNVSRDSVVNAKTVLREATPQEIHAIEAGTAAVSTVAKQIRSKVPAQKRAKRQSAPLSQAGKNPERIQRLQINAEIWGRIRDSLTHLTSLPMPEDAAAIAHTNDRTGLVDLKLPKAIQWLKEFSDAWNADV